MKAPARKSSAGSGSRSSTPKAQSSSASLGAAAHAVSLLLVQSESRLVLAESCTGGLVSASLAAIPGISDWLCGSLVTYRNDAKTQWLGISKRVLNRAGAVSRIVAEAMACAALKKTPEARLAASITGHLGPGAPGKQDGQIFIAIAMRQTKNPRGKPHVLCEQFRLLTDRSRRTTTPVASTPAAIKKAAQSGAAVRAKRQVLASHAVLFMVRSLLESGSF